MTDKNKRQKDFNKEKSYWLMRLRSLNLLRSLCLNTRIKIISRPLSLICIALILKMVISYQRNVEITYESFLPWFLRDGLFQRSAIQQIIFKISYDQSKIKNHFFFHFVFFCSHQFWFTVHTPSQTDLCWHEEHKS